jgi:myo-inositol-1(or 4)-monophosphatase
LFIMLDFAIQLARSAGAILRDHYERALSIEHKSTEIELVTDVDRAAEALIVSAIRSRFPDHALFTEEAQGAAGPDRRAEYTWIVDPLDGTTNYTHGYPMFTVSIALQRGTDLVLGVVYDPLRDELFAAERAQGVYLNGQRRRVSTTDRLVRSVVATGFAYNRATIPDNNVAEFGRVALKVQGIRRGGSAALDMACVAAGRLDGYWEMNLAPWDWAAGVVLVTEAGGVITDLDGGPWDLSKKRIVATNGLIHAELLQALHGDET